MVISAQNGAFEVDTFVEHRFIGRVHREESRWGGLEPSSTGVMGPIRDSSLTVCSGMSSDSNEGLDERWVLVRSVAGEGAGGLVAGDVHGPRASLQRCL